MNTDKDPQVEMVSDVLPGWTDGEPKRFYGEEWFIAETTHGERVVLKALPEEYNYDYTTADGTYFKADKIKRWMQFPRSQYISPAQAALNARAGGDGWLPIESVPKDGSEFQAWFTNDDGSIGDWEPRARVNDDGNIEFWGRVDYDQDGWIRYPELIYTHWQPLPTPPAALASQAVGVNGE